MRHSSSRTDYHAQGSLEYRHTSAEALRDEGEQFDLVCAMEVLEHVDQPGEFLKCLGDMVRVGALQIHNNLSIIKHN